MLRKWLRRLPHPFTGADRRAGYRYDLSILQAEFSLTQVLDRPQHGRQFFEQVICENLDLGRPEQMQLIFRRRVQRNTPGLFRSRILTQDVTPSLHVYYKNTRIKQYHKESRALRTETTINNTYDFGIGKRLCNLPELRAIGFAANRRLIEAERLSHDCVLAEHTFQAVTSPITAGRQRASGLRFADARTRPLLEALILFRQLPDGFRSADLRHNLAALSARSPQAISQGAATYQLRPPAPARPHRASAEELPLPRHRPRPARRLVLHTRLQPPPASRPRWPRFLSCVPSAHPSGAPSILSTHSSAPRSDKPGLPHENLTRLHQVF